MRRDRAAWAKERAAGRIRRVLGMRIRRREGNGARNTESEIKGRSWREERREGVEEGEGRVARNERMETKIVPATRNEGKISFRLLARSPELLYCETANYCVVRGNHGPPSFVSCPLPRAVLPLNPPYSFALLFSSFLSSNRRRIHHLTRSRAPSVRHFFLSRRGRAAKRRDRPSKRRVLLPRCSRYSLRWCAERRSLDSREGEKKRRWSRDIAASRSNRAPRETY